MKYLAVVFAALIAGCYAADPLTLSDEQRQRVRDVAKACIAQEQVTPEAVQKLREGNFASNDPKIRCFANCFLEKFGFLADGVPQQAVIAEKLGAIVGQDKINSIMQQCNGLRGADNCATAFKLYECYYKNKAGII